MEMILEALFYIAGGALATYLGLRYLDQARLQRSRAQARNIIEQAEQQAELESRSRKAELELELGRKRTVVEKDLVHQGQELQRWQGRLESQAQELRRERGSIKRRELELLERRQQLEAHQEHYRKRLESLTGMNKADVIEALKQDVRQECAQEMALLREDIVGQSEEELRAEAQRIIVDTLQRFSGTASGNIGATLVKLPNEGMKGRLIGREGRNIHSFEAATGTTLMIDETPESVLVSSFDPVRREIARIALEELIQDGRIHPGTIEDAVARAETRIRENVVQLGEEAAAKLKIRGLDIEITSLLGKLHFYLSNNQRTLEHSVETAYICSIMASELGLNPDIAKRAGLLHDIGKAITEEYEGSHARAGALLLKTHGEIPTIVNAVEAHHNEVPTQSVYAVLVQVADALSSTRPGARSETIEGYIRRIANLEELAKSFDGVRDAYALRAGRELRVIVSPEHINDETAARLAREVRQRIEEEFTYPGNIRITVIREQRYTETAT